MPTTLQPGETTSAPLRASDRIHVTFSPDAEYTLATSSLDELSGPGNYAAGAKQPDLRRPISPSEAPKGATDFFLPSRETDTTLFLTNTGAAPATVTITALSPDSQAPSHVEGVPAVPPTVLL